ncbi:hypothetical protein [Archangium lansingense]|uniref:Lipoprotein n=1 Tax=Archangium lansingense TaxID=2995310 RepID=A0ABT4A0P8_9BACT|nr:hypothetical protein [Archangium lansinium]MCY1075228.1 hypothetical protein [Archangium lansinium]
MTLRPTPRKLVAAALSVLLVSCSATRYTTPTSAEELAGLVLILNELPDGQMTHSWQRAEDFDLARYRPQSSNHSPYGRIVLVAARPRDCDQELQDCYQDCMRRPLAPGYGHVKTPRKGGGKSEYCRDACWQAYQDCVELQKLQPQEFTAVDSAIDWLKRNHKMILVGSAVMIAGVVFVVVSAGAGVVVLAPIALVASPAIPSEPYIVGVLP